MYKIGDFSKMTGLSIRTLRFYEEKGVIVPAYIDNFTGYRYYDESNLLDVKKINCLKFCGFSLEEISLIKDNISLESIDSKISETEDNIKMLNDRYKLLLLFRSELENLGKINYEGNIRTLNKGRKAA